MKTVLQYLLGKLAEEAAEVAQIALKTSDFGLDEVMPGQPYSNRERCCQELDDMMGVLKSLKEQCGFAYKPNDGAIDAKQVKIEKYKAYSISLGLVEGPRVVPPLPHPMTVQLAAPKVKPVKVAKVKVAKVKVKASPVAAYPMCAMISSD